MQLARFSYIPSYKDFQQFCNPAPACVAAILIATVCLHLKTIAATYIVNKLFHNRFSFFGIFKENIT